MLIYQEDNFYIELEQSEIPWVKLFTTEPYKEIGDMPQELRQRLWEIYDAIELVMKRYFKPDKINMASFANMLPRVHIHIMARFKEDSYFPNSMWGEKVRDTNLDLPDFETFYKELVEVLEKKR